MPHHKSAIKRVRTNKKCQLRNTHEKKTLRTLLKNLKAATDPVEAEKVLGLTISRLDRDARKGLIDKNNAIFPGEYCKIYS